jgi:hypothetical protein
VNHLWHEGHRPSNEADMDVMVSWNMAKQGAHRIGMRHLQSNGKS